LEVFIHKAILLIKAPEFTEKEERKLAENARLFFRHSPVPLAASRIPHG
jgi:hypothetical protein